MSLESRSLPTVDILMPVHNAAQHLAECLDSLVSQTYPNFRIVILDDASTDDTAAILQHYCARHNNIIVHRNQRNRGIIESRNHLFDISDATYMAVMDADDICHPDRVANQVDFLERNPGHAVVGSWYELFGATTFTCKPPTDHSAIRACMSITNAICNPAAMVRRSSLNEAGLRCDPAFRGSADYKLWLDCSQRFGVANLPKVLLRYRRHDQQESSVNVARQRDAHFRILRQFWAPYGLEPTRPEVNALVWQEESTLDEVREAGSWAARVFGSFSHPDPDLHREILRLIDIRLRRCCNRRGIAGLSIYLRHQGFRQLRKGKYFGMAFVKDCVRQSFRWE